MSRPNLNDNILTLILEALPASLPPESREDIAQDVAVLVYEGQISLENLTVGIRERIPELRKRYPSLRFTLSLDAPINQSEGTTMTFNDVIAGPGALPKRRGKRIGRPIEYEILKSVCENCEEIFYWKHYIKKLTKRQQERLRFLPDIDPVFWKEDDIDILRIANPALLARRTNKRQSVRTGRFCSRTCLTEFYRNKRRKLPPREVLMDLYVNQRLSTVKIANMYHASDPSVVRQALVKYGIPRRFGSETKTQTCDYPDCKEPVHRIRHAGNGSEYGTLCKKHWKLHRAELNRWQRRKDHNIPPERWLYQNERPK